MPAADALPFALVDALVAAARLAAEAIDLCVTPLTRHAIAVGGATLFIPGRAELAAILRSFGRTKDIERAPLLS